MTVEADGTGALYPVVYMPARRPARASTPCPATRCSTSRRSAHAEALAGRRSAAS